MTAEPDVATDGLAPDHAVGRRWGHGSPTFVLVHGLGVGSRMVAPLGRRLGRTGTALAPDLPGFGARAEEPERPFEAQRTWLASWVARQPPPVVLVGCSFGSQFALHAAARTPVAALVLASPTMDARRRRMVSQLLRWPLEVATQPAALRRMRKEDHQAAGMGRVLRTFRAALDDRPEDLLDGVAAPTLVVRGTLDPLVSTRWATEVAAGLPEGHLAVLPARHPMTYTDARRLEEAILAFLRRVGVA